MNVSFALRITNIDVTFLTYLIFVSILSLFKYPTLDPGAAAGGKKGKKKKKDDDDEDLDKILAELQLEYTGEAPAEPATAPIVDEPKEGDDKKKKKKKKDKSVAPQAGEDEVHFLSYLITWC